MVSRLLSAIDTSIRGTTSAAERMKLLAERAGLLARLGRFDAATAQIAELRAANTQFDPSITASILLSEGLVHHFTFATESARDRFRRSYAIAAAVGDGRVRRRAAAWLSASELQRDNIGAAAALAAEVIRDADEEEHSPLARAYLVAADLLNYVGDLGSASARYKKARHHAVVEGDLSMQSVILYNYAAFRVHQLALNILNGDSSNNDAPLVELDVTSIGHLDQGIDNKSLVTMVPMLHGQVLTIQGRWGDALATFGQSIERAADENLGREVPKALSCRALCHFGLGSLEAAAKDTESTVQALDQCVDLDDLAIVHSRLQRLLAVSHPERAQEHEAASIRCLALFRERQQADLEVVKTHLGQMTK